MMESLSTPAAEPATPAAVPSRERVVPREYVAPFAIVTTLFALWGFANDITNPMVKAFKNVLLLTHTESALVQSAFYGGYCAMAIPAALFLRRFGYKAGILVGLGLYAVGCLLFLPAAWTESFAPFLAAYFVMTSGLAFLETTANPYILAMGPQHNAPRRLNLAQAFNPMGSLLGMFVAMDLILARLNQADEATRRTMAESDPTALAAIREMDLGVIVWPYAILGVVVLAVLGVFASLPLPRAELDSDRDQSLAATFLRLQGNWRYLSGVVAQAFYVGAQIMCWTFIIQYGENELGMKPELAQAFNIGAMVVFIASRFLCTYLLKEVEPGSLLSVFAVGGAALVLGAMLLPGMAGLFSLVGVSACMSLMFPTIYGIALEGLGDDAKLASAGLICAIGGGCVMPPLQAKIMDGHAWTIGAMSLSPTRASFVLPLVCFVVIAIYGVTVASSRRKAT